MRSCARRWRRIAAWTSTISRSIANVGEELVGVEALVRWDHPTLGSLGPTQFIPVAEETGLIFELGEWVLASACETLRPWPEIALAVNVSPVQLRDPQLAQRLLRIVRERGFDPTRLQLEVTENALFNADGVVACSLRDLRAAGVRIALDDFGTGYSSLAHLRRLEVDKVKIDRSFVQHLGHSADSAAIVQAVANIGKTLGLMVTAEGVETEEQRRVSRRNRLHGAAGLSLLAPAFEARDHRIAVRTLRGPGGRLGARRPAASFST